jgi:hypothetical protein
MIMNEVSNMFIFMPVCILFPVKESSIEGRQHGRTEGPFSPFFDIDIALLN